MSHNEKHLCYLSKNPIFLHLRQHILYMAKIKQNISECHSTHFLYNFHIIEIFSICHLRHLHNGVQSKLALPQLQWEQSSLHEHFISCWQDLDSSGMLSQTGTHWSPSLFHENSSGEGTTICGNSLEDHIPAWCNARRVCWSGASYRFTEKKQQSFVILIIWKKFILEVKFL